MTGKGMAIETILRQKGAVKLKRIRIIVRIRRDQRSEVWDEIRVGMDMAIHLMPATLCD